MIASLEASGDVELHGFGVGYSVGAFYGRGEDVEEPEEVGLALLVQIERLLIP